MKLTKEEFVRKYRYSLAGMAMYGLSIEQKGESFGITRRMFELPDEVEKVLSIMYDSLDPSTTESVIPTVKVFNKGA